MAAKAKTTSKNPLIDTIILSLNELIYDQNTPQNIRTNALSISKVLTNENGNIEQRKNHAMQLLEEMISDINIDACTRTILFSAITRVESLSD